MFEGLRVKTIRNYWENMSASLQIKSKQTQTIQFISETLRNQSRNLSSLQIVFFNDAGELRCKTLVLLRRNQIFLLRSNRNIWKTMVLNVFKYKVTETIEETIFATMQAMSSTRRSPEFARWTRRWTWSFRRSSSTRCYTMVIVRACQTHIPTSTQA